ncbi:hypothetical protein [Celeribacter halophilus]|uniref:DUF4189 domain-containing protein n=1 Tax=Celeribacter halophilus TaxID=576117 RepID=A0A1I3RT65_9RHOB|nr:hypothetical protein [Celeribacter halophilus]PZX12716.1 hypothetical protein LX82_01460 [Celeribacter halophilus]SFJ48491.1 hypothetical protein SAMN04488138_105222 [Celeribacter halophilus]
MNTQTFLLTATLALTSGLAAQAETRTMDFASTADGYLILAQSSGGQQQRPPSEAMDACSGKSSGASCSFSGRDGESMSGTCSSPDSNAPLACTPEGGPRS